MRNSGPKIHTTVEKLKLAIDSHRQGRLDEAEKIYRAVLKTQPSNPDALHFFGVLLHQRGRSNEAIVRIERALRVNPSYLDARMNLGNIYKETGDMAKAAAIFRKVIAMKPDHVNAYNNLGVVLRKAGDLDESVRMLQKVLALDPDNADCLHNLGNCYQDQHQIQKAVEAYLRSIALKPKQKDAYESLWQMFRRKGEIAAAADVLAKWLEADPENPIAKHYMSACAGVDIPDRASDAYVQQTFDDFAASFDAVLKGLDYRAPELTAQAVAEVFPEPQNRLFLLDAGCGTGLCGAFLKPYARKLIGVDLSPAMLSKAEGRGLYDELAEAELVEYIGRYSEAFDLIVSADTLCYFGELQAFFRATRDALRAGGCLVFTLEKIEDGAFGDFKLNHHGRYSHRSDYVSRALDACGLTLLSLRTVVLRMERGAPVAGLLVTAILK
ncbi:tetratricopeptide repeat protein [Methylomicrobium sp. Wu6]|uniref:tetratricopeptide repeat protein n=1 Tax=Methylomicrobium sp. Wu6 TaxID=3107928 RepID=UPI002DD6A1EB|nr:tetratricopeptide repeat protein [Methylomicrobium sp. Wu6]MEC4748858.1 tetratricopeptide repeat protein [Methylomicrobium sp. Wu6]